MIRFCLVVCFGGRICGVRFIMLWLLVVWRV